MNILTTISYYTPHISGLTICTQRLIDGLAKRGFHFTVLTSRHDRSLPTEERQNDVTIVRLPVLATIGKVPIMPSYPFILLRMIKNHDLMWIHVPQAEGVLVALLAKLMGKRIVSTVHCLPFLPPGWQRRLFQRLFDLLNNLVILLSDHVVYDAEDYARNTPELWHFPRKSSYLFPPIPEPKKRLQVKRLKNSKPKSFRIGFAGRVAADKGLEYLIEAVATARKKYPVMLYIVGPKTAVGEHAYRERIEQLIHTHKNIIRFVGEIPSDKMPDFFQSIDALALPSVNRTEAFGMVQVEAMKHGVPVIASDLPGVRVPVQKTGFGVIVPPRDIDALVQAIDSIRDQTWDMTAVRHRVATLFNPATCVDSYLSIFRSV